MSYRLGGDLGTTFTAAAVADGSEPTVIGLGNRALQIPSVLF
jgi:molecular chaperone DnaK